MPTNRYGIYYPTSSEDESEDEQPATTTSTFTMNMGGGNQVGSNLGYTRPTVEPPRIIPPKVNPAPAEESSDSEDDEVIGEKPTSSSEDESRGKQVAPSESEESDAEIAKAEELSLDDIDVKEVPKTPMLAPPTPVKKYQRSASNASSMHPPQNKGLDLDEITRKKAEKDLCELQALINYHFEERKKEEKELAELKDRIEKRKKMRQEQLIIRRQREKERREREKEERLRKEQEAREKIEAEELKKKELLAAMSMHFTGDRDRADRRKGRRNTARDAKRRVLAERRKPLNIDHLNKEKLMEKTQEIYDWLVSLETERYDHEHKVGIQKYELSTLRHRVNDLINKTGKNKPRVGKLKIPAM